MTEAPERICVDEAWAIGLDSSKPGMHCDDAETYVRADVAERWKSERDAYRHTLETLQDVVSEQDYDMIAKVLETEGDAP